MCYLKCGNCGQSVVKKTKNPLKSMSGTLTTLGTPIFKNIFKIIFVVKKDYISNLIAFTN